MGLFRIDGSAELVVALLINILHLALISALVNPAKRLCLCSSFPYILQKLSI
jgi:hypothetical protein